MAFEVKNVAIIDINDSKIDGDVVDKNLILKLSKNNKFWERTKDMQNFQHYLLVINKPKITKIIYSKANSEFIKKIY